MTQHVKGKGYRGDSRRRRCNILFYFSSTKVYAPRHILLAFHTVITTAYQFHRRVEKRL